MLRYIQLSMFRSIFRLDGFDRDEGGIVLRILENFLENTSYEVYGEEFLGISSTSDPERNAPFGTAFFGMIGRK